MFKLIKQALVAAWKAACKVSGATVKIPAQFRFLISPITLQGPCMPHLTLQVRFIYIYTQLIKGPSIFSCIFNIMLLKIIIK